MKIIKSIKRVREILEKEKFKRKTIGFVPTMGALHEGHLSLIKKARKENGLVVVSIFVNPVQFGPREDLKKYPRNLMQDIKLCRKQEVDLIFYPSANQMYPASYNTYVNVEQLSDRLCGKYRPGHFRGVATIVTKLFNIIQPTNAYFGAKDAQQAIIIKKMTEDLNMPCNIKILPTIRAKDGLALSSRNRYLDRNQRQDAKILYRALKKAEESIKKGRRNSREIIAMMKKMINDKKSAKIDYISIVDLKNLKSVAIIKDKVLIALAVWFGKARLIDNLIINGRKN